MGKLKVHLYFIVLFGVWLATMSLLWKYPVLLTVLLLAITFVYFAFLKKGKEHYYFIVAAIAGPIGEAIVSRSGLWTYYGSTVFGVPVWLPLAWGITFVVIKRYIDSLVN